MASVLGRPFLEHLLDYWHDQGVKRFILSVGYKREVIIDHFKNNYLGAKIEYAIEETALGTGGGLALAAKNIPIDEYFLLLNGDTFFAVDLHKLTTFTEHKKADCCFSLFRSQENGRYMNVELNENAEIKELNSVRGNIGSLANGGVYYLRRSALMEGHFAAQTKLSLEDDILPTALTARKKLVGLELKSTFIDIGLPEDYLRAGKVIGKES